jgi:hypothetical protein
MGCAEEAPTFMATAFRETTGRIAAAIASKKPRVRAKMVDEEPVSIA